MSDLRTSMALSADDAVAIAEMPREQKRNGVSAEESRYGWEKTAGGADEYIRFNLAATALAADEKKKIDTLVLLKETPVAGRPVNLSKP